MYGFAVALVQVSGRRFCLLVGLLQPVSRSACCRHSSSCGTLHADVFAAQSGITVLIFLCGWSLLPFRCIGRCVVGGAGWVFNGRLSVRIKVHSSGVFAHFLR